MFVMLFDDVGDFSGNAGIIAFYHEQHGFFGLGDPTEEKQKDRDNDGECNGKADHSGADDDTGTDGPEQEYQIQGFLDGRSKTDDGEGAHHAEGYHDAVLHGYENCGRDHAKEHEGQIKGFGIEDGFCHHAIDQKDENAHKCRCKEIQQDHFDRQGIRLICL